MSRTDADGDLSPPPFAEGLADWSRGDGTPDSATYEGWLAARVARDPAFGPCLELRLTETAQSLRYMGELPVGRAPVELRVRLRSVRGPAPEARLAAWPGAAGGHAVAGLDGAGPWTALPADGAPVELRLSIGRTWRPAPHVIWDARAVYAHVGLDLVGEPGAVARIDDFRARLLASPPPPGFGDAQAERRVQAIAGTERSS